MAPPAEHVLVYPRALLDELGTFCGLRVEAERYVETILQPVHLTWRLREEAESDPSFKQIIPYVVLAHDGRVFSYTRGKRAGERRLVAQRSVGIGGHICQEDHSLFAEFGRELYEAAKLREVEEEVAVESPYTERLLGVINDDRTEVGQVHFGIAYVWELTEPRVEKREAQITQTAFTPVADLLAQPEALESWSLFCVQALAREQGVLPPA